MAARFVACRSKNSPIGRDRRAFEATPNAYLLLDRDFTIIDVNSAYLRATMTESEQILGRDIFDIFPDNPGDPAADGVGNLSASFKAVLATRADDAMLLQRYDIRDQDGVFIERYWRPKNCPLLDHNGEVEFILHYVVDVTAFVGGTTDLGQLRSWRTAAPKFRGWNG